MYRRVVRFTGVTREHIDRLRQRIEEADGPPPGVTTTGLEILFDEAQGTAIVVQKYATAEDMSAAERIFDAMDPGETPGTRTSVDRCEVALEREVS